MERQTLAAGEHPCEGNVSVGSWNSAADKCEGMWAEHTQHLLHPAVFPVSYPPGPTHSMLQAVDATMTIARIEWGS